MSGTNYLIDTNIIIYLSQGRLKISNFAKNSSNLYISSITYIETLGYTFPNENEEKIITDLCDMFERLYVTKDVESQTILIRKAHKIKLPDAIIAATAMTHDLTLVTCDSRDFGRILGLKLFVPLT